MSRDINLAKLNKKKEEISKIEMEKLTSGGPVNTVDPGESCTCDPTFIYTDVWETDEIRNCHCGSIWVVFGLAL